ncbi:ABC transporter substrate-binding protein [Maridesulfovibrio sp.]|uniref:substrate-binding periplasmic protein n=1 Tax=Maridesulfovibrio sp. TaxID=2795000 RepID=UPI002A18A318|nr:ABC transporter substrate-binding protein [Maridesulfovibrio sp.]
MFKIVNLSIVAVMVVIFIPIYASAFTLKTYYQDGFPKYYIENVDNVCVVRGLCSEIIKLIEEKAPNIKFDAPPELVKFSRIKHDLYNGVIDVFLGMTRTPSRENQFIYLDPPLYRIRHVLAMRRDDYVEIKSFNDIRRLKGNGKILTNHGTSSEKFLTKQGGLVIDAGATTLSQNLMKLDKGRGRFIYFHDLGLINTIRHGGWGKKVKILPVVFYTYSHYLVFSKHADPEAVKIVQRVLNEIAESGELQSVTAQYFKDII